jgi:hypothetical protein
MLNFKVLLEWRAELFFYSFIKLQMNALSNTTVSKLADALKKEVINKIYERPEYAELMQDLIPDAIHSLMGEMDEDLAFEIGMLLFDRIELK